MSKWEFIIDKYNAYITNGDEKIVLIEFSWGEEEPQYDGIRRLAEILNEQQKFIDDYREIHGEEKE